MKVLVISHNCFSRSTNMGKTLSSYFGAFSREEIAQFYIQPETTEETFPCRQYYRFTDRDALRSLFPIGTYGRVMRETKTDAGKDGGMTGWLYRRGRKRTAGVYFLRNLLWKCSRWDTKQFWQWAENFDPDVVFLASGDYGFLYDLAGRVAARLGKPLVISCVDDYYLYNRNENSLLGRLSHRSFLKTVHRTMRQAKAVFVICDSMKEAYETLFRKKCYVLRTGAEKWPQAETMGGQLSYIGNLDNQRYQGLVEMGRTLRAISKPGLPQYLDVYSGERDPAILREMTEENGICFHGAVPPEMVKSVMARSMAVVHVESFGERERNIVRFSVSTKIAESLMNGPCLIAYGPEGIASVDYLKKHGAAYTITSPEQLAQGLEAILSDEKLRLRIVARARELAQANHSMEKNQAKVRKWLEEICEETDMEC